MSRTYTLTVPAPAPWINANARGSWQARHRLTRVWRDAAWAAAKGARLPLIEGHVHIVATIHKASPNAYDAANWAPTAKAAVDGLRDAGVLRDDSNKYVTGPDMRPGARSDKPRLIITITELDQEEA